MTFAVDQIKRSSGSERDLGNVPLISMDPDPQRGTGRTPSIHTGTSCCKHPDLAFYLVNATNQSHRRQVFFSELENSVSRGWRSQPPTVALERRKPVSRSAIN